jgi:site-specific recombinase XerD
VQEPLQDLECIKSRYEIGFRTINSHPVELLKAWHGTGYYLANRGIDTRTIQSYLGHNNIQHTVRYTELASTKFQGLWDG